MTDATDPATSTVAAVPPGYTALTPFLCVSDGSAALDFYCRAFGATLVSRMDTPPGGVAHAELDFGSSSWLTRCRTTGWSRRPVRTPSTTPSASTFPTSMR